MRVLIVKCKINAEFREKFVEALRGDARGANRDEPGCLRSGVLQDEADPNRIYPHEVYKDEAAFDVHPKFPHYIQWRDIVKDEWFTEPVETGHGWNVYPTDGDWK